MSSNNILGVRFDDFSTKDEFLGRMLQELEHAKAAKQSKLIAHLNVHCLNLASSNKEYNKLLNQADVLFFDSAGLKLVANALLRLKVSFASTPPDWMHEFFNRVPEGTKVFFVGDEPEVISSYNKLFFRSFPRLHAAGCHHGYFLHKPEMQEELMAQLEVIRPDIVLVGMGMPVQEFWIQQVRERVSIPMFIPVGAYYQRMTGKQKRPSDMLVKMGLEWLHRLILNPQTMFKRYVIGNPVFLYRVLKHQLRQSNFSEMKALQKFQKTS